MTSAVDRSANLGFTPAESAPSERNVVVMVVDDDPHILMVMEELLGCPGRELRFAASGRAALRELRRVSPAVLLLDVNLGDMSGFELAGLVRSNERLAHTPIVFITGTDPGEEGLTSAYGLGAVDYLSKPIVPAILQSKVNALCTLALQVQEIKWQRDRLAEMRAALGEANEALRELASRDPLTGLLNRREFISSLTILRSYQARYGRLHALLALDLDRFKQVNDAFGHAAGDQVLLQAGTRMRDALRTPDLVARMGGDEFCILIHEVESAQALADIAGRVKEQLAGPYELADGQSVLCPASIGAVMLEPADGTGVEQLMAAADAAMYRAKRSGCGVAFAGGGTQ